MPAMDALTAKHTLTDELPTDFYRRYMTYFMKHVGEGRGERASKEHWIQEADEMIRNMQTWLKASETFYVHPHMNDLITAASESLPDEPLLPEDLPTQFGMVLIPGGLTTIDVRGSLLVSNAVMWASFGGRVYLTFLTDKYDTKDPHHGDWKYDMLPRYTPTHFGQIPFRESLPTSWGPTMLIPPEYGVHINYVHRPDGGMDVVFASDKGLSSDEMKEMFDFGERPDPMLRWLVTKWRLMQQPLTSLVKEEPPRQMRRRLERQNIPDRHVTVVTLRRKAGERQSDTEVQWSHRWLVRGHWRKQWYGSGEDRVQRSIWIHPHIKGPDDAPLLVREHIYSLER